MTSMMPRPTVAQLIAFEAAHPSPHGAKEELIRAELGVTPARYYQLLHRAITTEEAALADPVTTHRLRRLTATRRAARDARLTLPAN